MSWVSWTPFGPPVVPEVVKVKHGASPVASSAPASAGAPSSCLAGTPASSLTPGEMGSPSTQRTSARSCGGSAAKIAGKSTGGKSHCVTSATARDRRSRLPISAARKRVLLWIASAPSRAQANIAARYPIPFGSHNPTRAPGPMPARRNPAAMRSTRSWNAQRSSVTPASVMTGAAGSRADHAVSAVSVRG